MPLIGDANARGASAAACAVVYQPSGTSQGLIVSKSRLSKKELTIPRLELVFGHMVANLLHNIRETVQHLPIRQEYGWLDSSVALHWITGNGEYKQFLNNRVKKIQKKNYIKWRHVPSAQNPADVGSRGGSTSQLKKLWWNGPDWLPQPKNWPEDIVTSSTKECEAEVKVVRQVLAIAIEVQPDN